MTKEQRALAIAARAKLAKLTHTCDDACPGWGVFHSAMYGGLMICVCIDCWHKVPRDEQLMDEEVAALPEAQKLLREEAKAEGVEPCGNDVLYGAVWS